MKCSPTQKVYNVHGCGTPVAIISVKPKATPAPTTQTLPFTGLDLGLVASAGFVLVAMGVSLRRLTRKRSF